MPHVPYFMRKPVHGNIWLFSVGYLRDVISTLIGTTTHLIGLRYTYQLLPTPASAHRLAKLQ